jgi:hypothetical protein
MFTAARDGHVIDEEENLVEQEEAVTVLKEAELLFVW